MATIETISIVFTGISISLAAFYYINTLARAESPEIREDVIGGRKDAKEI